MKLSADRNNLLNGLMRVLGGIEKKQTMQILGNVYLEATEQGLTLMGTDMEIQLSTRIDVVVDQPGRTTVNARKFNDIIKAAPNEATIQLTLSDQWLIVQIHRSQFRLATLDPDTFPVMSSDSDEINVAFQEGDLVNLIETTQFAMAQQDVRYFLNGLLLEIAANHVRTVATDGHRLAMSEMDMQTGLAEPRQMIVPRKTVTELLRLLNRDAEQTISLQIGTNQICISAEQTTLISKLIDGRYPDYNRVIPTNNPKHVTVNGQELRGALTRAAVLSNERFAGASFSIGDSKMVIEANNSDQETSQEEISVDYHDDPLKISFNINYLMNVIAAVHTDDLIIELMAPESSALLRATEDSHIRSRYVLMPMKL